MESSWDTLNIMCFGPVFLLTSLKSLAIFFLYAVSIWKKLDAILHPNLCEKAEGRQLMWMRRNRHWSRQVSGPRERASPHLRCEVVRDAHWWSLSLVCNSQGCSIASGKDLRSDDRQRCQVITVSTWAGPEFSKGDSYYFFNFKEQWRQHPCRCKNVSDIADTHCRKYTSAASWPSSTWKIH